VYRRADILGLVLVLMVKVTFSGTVVCAIRMTVVDLGD
jgi:hypothetical protein